MDAGFDGLKKDVRVDLEKFRGDLAGFRGEQILVRWMFGILISTNIAMLAIAIRYFI